MSNLNNERLRAYDLDWDTQHFGVKCARVDLNSKITQDDMLHIKTFINENEFITITVQKGNIQNNYYVAKKLGAVLSDVNLQFIKIPVENNDVLKDMDYIVSNNYSYDLDLVELSKKCFKYSRFFNDNNILIDQAKEVYSNWVINSFNKENKYFIVAKKNNKSIGYLLFSINDKNEIIIELVCISNEHQGQGVGRRLIEVVNSFSIKEGISFIKVGTQIENLEAINFYQSCGFKLVDVVYIYHLWSEKEKIR